MAKTKKKTILEIYHWEREKDKGHGYKIESMYLDDIPFVIAELEIIKQKLIKDLMKQWN